MLEGALIVRLPAALGGRGVELTEAGEAAFQRWRVAAVEFDSRLRSGLRSPEVEQLRGLLDRLSANVATTT